MGALHAGHASLIRSARASSAHLFVTLFVNPAQFGPQEDLKRYPRTEDDDLRRCAQLGVDCVFAPDRVEEMYPPSRLGRWPTTVQVACGSATHHRGSEGASRPGFFVGVATVVCKLLHIVQPDVAWFGAKDAQQCCVVRRMVRDLNMAVEVREAPTVREPDGLALSSRNRYLTPAERACAPTIYEALCAGQEVWATRCAECARDERGLRRSDLYVVLQRVAQRLRQQPALRVIYVSAADVDAWTDWGTILGEEDGLNAPAPSDRDEEIGEEVCEVALCVAAWLGGARLIDNVRLMVSRAHPREA